MIGLEIGGRSEGYSEWKQNRCQSPGCAKVFSQDAQDGNLTTCPLGDPKHCGSGDGGKEERCECKDHCQVERFLTQKGTIHV